MTPWQEAMLYFTFGYVLSRVIYLVWYACGRVRIRLRWGVW